MEPSAEPTPPAEVETSFGEVVTLLDQAERTAPSELRDDVTRYATAIDDYVAALAAVDFDLDAIFSTPEGAQLAQDTSHALTPDIVNYMTGPCGISLGETNAEHPRRRSVALVGVPGSRAVLAPLPRRELT